MTVSVAVEGITDETIIQKILAYVGLEWRFIRNHGGKSRLINKLYKYNQAAQFQRWLVVIDLDKNPCPVTYHDELLSDIAENMILRIAVREIEAWLLAD